MEEIDEEIKEFIYLLKGHTPLYRKKLLKKMRNSYKMNFRGLTKRYMKEHDIRFKECINCKDDFHVEIHHLNYENPYIVSPLCKRCHGEQHRKNGNKVLYINLETGEQFYDKFRVC